jgi:hypothetical protein
MNLSKADLGHSYWTSGSDDGHEGLWVWTSTGKQSIYTNWNTGQPDNYKGSEHYLLKNHGGRSKWNDNPGTNTAYAICEATP